MKKVFAILLAFAMVFALAACSGGGEPEPEPEVDIFAKGEGVMTYAEYAAAAPGTEVTVETFVQAAQSWWNNTITVYTQDNEGGYYLYEMACTEEDAEKLVPGTKIKVTGQKSEEYGEVEIKGGTFEIEEDAAYIAAPLDVTAVLDTEDMIKYQNMYVLFSDMEVVGEPVFEWDNSGADGDDIYFQVEKDGQVFTFMVESYLTGSGTDAYEAVKKLQKGDRVDLEGFCYWYDGLTPHITGVTMK
ncbi:MAG: hypothetical protein II474_01635 [Firmicutes bacterium]|nr:hypothetical protein [Bacillota bacterium]